MIYGYVADLEVVHEEIEHEDYQYKYEEHQLNASRIVVEEGNYDNSCGLVS